jgi:DNA polymerase-3 subunit delta
MSAMPDAALTTLRLLLGEEELLVSRAVAEVVGAARAADPDADIRDVPAAGLPPGEVAELLSPSLFGGRRVLVVRDAHQAGKDLVAALSGYAADAVEDVTLVVAHSGGGAKAAKSLVEVMKNAGAEVVSCARVTKYRDKVAFVRREVQRNGGRCSEDAAQLMLDNVGSDLRELASVCAQLTSDTGGNVDVAAVRRYHSGRADVSGFTVADAVMVGDSPAALEALRWAMNIGVDPVPVADALADGVRTVAKVAAAGSGNPYRLASQLGMPPWKVERAQRQAKGWSGPGLSRAMQIAAETNAQVKGGAEDRVHALERAVLTMVDARGRS